MRATIRIIETIDSNPGVFRVLSHTDLTDDASGPPTLIAIPGGLPDLAAMHYWIEVTLHPEPIPARYGKPMIGLPDETDADAHNDAIRQQTEDDIRNHPNNRKR